jgi:hypothetical protein
MILYLVQSSSKTKVFYSEDLVNRFLTNEQISGHDISGYSVTIFEGEIKSETIGQSYLNNYTQSIERESKLDATLGDDYATNVEKLKQMVIEIANDTPQKTAFIKRLNITPSEKSKISRLLTSNVDFVLYEVAIAAGDNLPEYYKCLLKLHNFRKIDDKFVRETYNKSGYVHTRSNCVTPDRCKIVFKEVKS